MSNDQNIIALEEKILFLEDNLHKLDEVVRKQYDLIDTLTRRIKSLEDKTDMLRDELEHQPATITDEKPPHY
jgi:uncharacterized coiled-coil protein SlyX